MSWYRSGTISCTLNNPTVTGIGTLWNSQASVSDMFLGPDLGLYEITSVIDNTHITIKSINSAATGYTGTTVSGSSNYAIIHAFAGLSNADLASRMANLLNSWQANEDMFSVWMAGAVSGGALDASGTGAVYTNGLVTNTTGGSGFYPLADSIGNITWSVCPAAMSNKVAFLSTYTPRTPALKNSIPLTSNWNDVLVALEVGIAGNGFAGATDTNHIFAFTNATVSGGVWKKSSNGVSTRYKQESDGSIVWNQSVSGAAGATITWLDKLIISSVGNLLVNGATEDGTTLKVNGTIKATTFTGAVSGNSSTATKLQNARYINSTLFDGTQDITIADGTKEPIINAGTSAQYWRGDKSWQTLNNSAVGLGNVENTKLSTWTGTTSLTTAGTLTVNSLSTSGQITSTAGTAIAPLVITSQVKVANLNSDFVDGFSASQTPSANQIPVVKSDSSLVLPGSLTATSFSTSGQITSTASTAVAPFVITSKVKVANLNSDFVGGFTASQTAGANQIPVINSDSSIDFPNAVRSTTSFSTSGTISSGSSYIGNSATSGGGGLIRLIASGGYCYIQAGNESSSTAAPIVFAGMFNSVDYGRFLGNGNFLVGTSIDIGGKLQVAASGNQNFYLSHTDSSVGRTSTLWLGCNNSTYKNSSTYMQSIEIDGLNNFHLAFGTGNYSTATEKMRITNIGNVLIGTSLDDGSGNILQVNGGIGAVGIIKSNGLSNGLITSTGNLSTNGLLTLSSTNTYSQITSTKGDNSTALPLAINSSGGAVWIGSTSDNGSGATVQVAGSLNLRVPSVTGVDSLTSVQLQASTIGYKIVGGKDAAGGALLSFNKTSSGLEVMRLSDTGNVLIGRTTEDISTYSLQVSGGISNTGDYYGVGSTSGIVLGTLGATGSSPSIILNSNYNIKNSMFQLTQDSLSAKFSYGLSSLLFLENSTASAGVVTERMRVSNGNLYVGFTADNGSGAKLQVNGITSSTDFIAKTAVSNFSMTAGAATNSLVWKDNNSSTEVMRIDSAGNLLVGIGSGSTHSIIKGSVQNNWLLTISGATQGCATFFSATTATANAAAAAMKLNANSTTSRSLNAAGTVNTSGNDYAEYETKSLSCGDVEKGQIIGFDVNGCVTDKWNESISFGVKTTNPSFVGGDNWGYEEITSKSPIEPSRTNETDEEWEEKETQYKADLVQFEAILEDARNKVDRIAYSGKVPCNITGARVGDYIVATQNGEGISGIVISNPSFEQYRNSVGRVRKILTDGRAEIAVIVH